MGFRKKLRRLVTRHPLLFYIRFALICRNLRRGEPLPEFADTNKKEDIPQVFVELSREIGLDPNADSFDRAMEIARFIRKRVAGGPGIGLSSTVTLDRMFNGRAGICSDYAQIFNLFCQANDIRVREWGCVETFYKPIYGHSFSEIYSEKLGKWVMMDVGKNLYFNRHDDPAPLSVLELFEYVRQGNPVGYTHFSSHICPDMHKIGLTYGRNMAPFVIANFVNKDYDQFLDKYSSKYPLPVVNAMLILTGRNHQFVFPMDNCRKMLLGEKRT